MELEFKDFYELDEGFFSLADKVIDWTSEKANRFKAWMRRLKFVSITTWNLIKGLIAAVPELINIIIEFPSYLRWMGKSGDSKELIQNFKLFEAGRKLAADPQLDKNKLEQECKTLLGLIKNHGEKAEIISKFTTSSVMHFANIIEQMFHPIGIAKNIPDVTIINAWRIISLIVKNKQAITTVGLSAVIAAILELIHFLFTTAFMTGLASKILIAVDHRMALFTGIGAWAGMALVMCFNNITKNSSEEDKKKFSFKVIATVAKMLDPSAKLELLDKLEKDDQTKTFPSNK
jgi:hypothetical protein